MTQEFHISITPVRDNEYLVRTEQVAPGVPLAEEQVVWPVDQWLEQTRQLMNDPLVGLLRGQTPLADTAIEGVADSTSLNGFMALGQQLYQSLFQGILRDSWMTAQGIAQHRGEVLRLRLGLKGTQLPRLPWEVMHSHSRDGLGLATHPLATGIHLLFSRYQPDRHLLRSGMALTPPTSSVLKILMVIATPTDQDDLDLDQEARQLQQELRLQPGHLQGNLVGSLPDIQVTILKQPSRTQLANALEQSRYQVLHYAGHSDVGTDGGKLYLVDQNGLAETLNGDDLAGLLVNNGIQMAVFNSCRGGHTADAEKHSQRTLTDALVSRGIPAVLAMAERIPDNVALTLTRLFYRNLKQGYPVDLSLSRARQGLLAAYGSNQLYWVLPTLYLHPDFDGYLTAGDRVLDNPADSLARMPQGYVPSLVDADSALDLHQVAASAPLPPLEGYQDEYASGEQDSERPIWEEQPFQTGATEVMGLESGDYIDPNYIDQDSLDQDIDFAVASNSSSDAYNDFEDVNPRYGDDEFLMSSAEMAELMSRATPAGPSVPDHLSQQDEEVVSGLLRDVTQGNQGDASPSPPSSPHPDIQHSRDAHSLSGNISGNLGAQAQQIRPAQPHRTDQTEPSAAIVHQPQANQLAPLESGRKNVDANGPDHQPQGKAPLRSPTTSAIKPRPAPGPLQPVGTAARTESHRRSRQPRWLYPIAGAAALAIAVVGYQAVQEFQPSSSETIAEVPREELITNVTDSLTQNKLEEARDWLDQVSYEDIDEPQIAFLQGRLRWELVNTGDTEFDIEDIRSYWELAAQKAGDKAEYYNALGFALYAGGQMNEAVQAWLKSLEILETQGVAVDLDAVNGGGSSIEISPDAIANENALTAYAGMALAFAQLAGESSTPVDLVSEVVRIQQVISNSNKAPQFERAQLEQNWLWTSSAIQEWELLSQLQGQ
ncbi:MAG: CHAT domain-containing protein [Cyanobacteria bacterium P01_F01_bin.150]